MAPWCGAPLRPPPLSKGLITGEKSFADCRLHDDDTYAGQKIERLGWTG